MCYKRVAKFKGIYKSTKKQKHKKQKVSKKQYVSVSVS